MTTKYDVIHFEALGAEAEHLKESTINAQNRGDLPKDLKYLITPLNIQDFLKENSDIELPNIISTKTHSKLPENYLSGDKKNIITRSAGYDHFESILKEANVTSLREYCVNAVAQTAIKFVYSTAGLLNHYTINTKTFERNKAKSFMELSKDRIATVYGVGKIGKKIYDLLENNDLTVQAVDVRAEELRLLDEYKNVNFVSKEKAIENSDIIVNAMSLGTIPGSRLYNINYFSKDYFSKAKPGLIFINVTRGEIAPEITLIELYNNNIISGIGVDVFSREGDFSRALLNEREFDEDILKADQYLVDRSIDRTANFYVQPHQAFNSDLAAISKAEEAINHLIDWYKNDKKHFSEQLPYYE